MKKLSLIVLSVVVLYGAAMASTAKKIACAVMPKNMVDIATATKNHQYADYKGRRYFFCCGGCPEEFAKDPAKYAKAKSIKTPKAPKATPAPAPAG